MVKIKDLTNVIPELFTFDQFIRDDLNPDVEICRTFGEINASEIFTLFVNQEPDIHTAHVDFDYLIKRRPNYMFLTAAWSNTHHWKVDQINFCSNILITARANADIAPVSIRKKSYNGLCLLGGSGGSRNETFRQIERLGLLDSCLVNIQQRPDQNSNYISYQSAAIKELDRPEFSGAYRNNGTFMSMVPVQNGIWLSQLISRNLYNHCYLDLVSETAVNYPDLFYISEKLSKTLIMGMPFLVSGCCGFLTHLRQLGFYTYGQWLDESYDRFANDEWRSKAIVDVLKDFSDWPEEKKIQFLHDSRPVAEHNRRLAMNSKYWLRPVVDLINTRVI